MTRDEIPSRPFPFPHDVCVTLDMYCLLPLFSVECFPPASFFRSPPLALSAHVTGFDRCRCCGVARRVLYHTCIVGLAYKSLNNCSRNHRCHNLFLWNTYDYVT